MVYLPVRIATREGKRAVQKSLQEAKETPSYTSKFKNFQKSSSYETVLPEFRAIQPNGVIEFDREKFDGSTAAFKVGMVGDRNLILA